MGSISAPKPQNPFVVQYKNIISLHYKDDGKGFDLSEAKKAKGLGMLGIENRVQILEATYSIETSPGKGMAVLVSVPVN